MFALRSRGWIQKNVLQRHGGETGSMLSKLKLNNAERQQNPFFIGKQAVDVAAGLHTSALNYQNLLKKMLSNKRKKRWYETPQPVLTVQPGFMKPTKKRNHEDSLRVRTLNTILYKAVSDLLFSHELNSDVLSYNVELTKVSLLADYSTCRIYWKTSLSAERDRQIQQALDKSAARIRYLLISQQVLSSVPPLVFVLDKQHAALKEVENLLKIADYGPSEDSETLSSSGKNAETKEHTEEKRKIMFGIDHDALYKQIEDFKRSRDSSVQPATSGHLTQEQLVKLMAIRKQKLIEKKKCKAKKIKDDDITPKEFLLAKQFLNEEQQVQYHSDQGLEDIQASDDAETDAG